MIVFTCDKCGNSKIVKYGLDTDLYFGFKMFGAENCMNVEGKDLCKSCSKEYIKNRKKASKKFANSLGDEK